MMTSTTFEHNQNESIIAHFGKATTKQFKKGEVVSQGTEAPGCLYFIESGYVKAYALSLDGHKNLLLIHGPHELIPLPWGLDGVDKINIYYEAMSPVVTKRDLKTSLRQTMGVNPWLAEQVLRLSINSLAVYTHRIKCLAYRTPRERVAACMMELGARFGSQCPLGTTVKAPVTHQDISDSTNMTRETTSRVIGQFAEESLISQKDRLFTINDEEKLRTFYE